MKTCEGDEYVSYLDYGDCFTGVYIYLKAYQIVYFKYMQLTVHSYTSGLPEWLTCQFWGHVFHPGPERFHMM